VLGGGCIRVLASGCVLSARSLAGLPDFELVIGRREGLEPSWWQHWRGFLERFVRSCKLSLQRLARSAGHTLYARQKGMRGRQRWFNLSMPARGLKTA
jgi:hypothetical protein